MDKEHQIIANAIQPENKRVLVVRDVEGDRTDAGLHLTDETRQKFDSGVIVSVADDCTKPYKYGQRIGFQKWAGVNTMIRCDDKKDRECVVLMEKDVTMVIQGDTRVYAGQKVAR